MPDQELIARVCHYADDNSAPDAPFETGIDGFTLVRSRAPTALEGMIYMPIVCLVLQGRKETYLGETPVSFGRGQSLIVSIDVPSLSRVVEASPGTPYVALALQLDMCEVRSLAEQIDEAEIAEERTVAIASGEADAALVAAMARLFDLVDPAAGAAGAAAARPARDPLPPAARPARRDAPPVVSPRQSREPYRPRPFAHPAGLCTANEGGRDGCRGRDEPFELP